MALRVFIALLSVGAVAGSEVGSTANPIRRVVNMLQSMQKKVQEDKEREEKLFEKYMCYCSNGQGGLQKSIAEAETKMPKVTSALTEATAKKEQLGSDLKAHTQDRENARDALAQAKAIREKEAATFAKEKADATTNLKALDGAIAAISEGSGTGFLQTSTAKAVRRLAIDMDMSSGDRDTVAAFLSQGGLESSAYAPASGPVLGILKQMRDTMAADLAELEKGEAEAIASFEGLAAAKTKEVAINSQSIEKKTARLGHTGVEIVNLKEDLDDTSASYAEDKEFLADLAENCKTKQEEWDTVQKTRAEEMLALADTIKILNEDDALELFKSTLSSPSLLQLKGEAKETRMHAIRALSVGKASDPRLEFLMLAIHGKKQSFEKVLGMIDEMVGILKKEQADDDSKKIYCEKELDSTEDQEKELELTIADLGKTIEATESALQTLTEEIEALIAGIRALDKSVSEASQMRQEENLDYKKTMAADTSAKKLLQLAKNRMHQFYNPTLYNEKMEAPAFVEIQLHARRQADAPPPPPEAVGAYKTKGEESAGVLAMMDMLVADLDKEMTEMSTEEKDSQAEYEKYVKDSAEKRRLDSKALEAKQGAKAEAEALLQRTSREKKSKTAEAYETSKVLRNLHQECDWLMSNFDVRKDARADEVDSLGKAKSILSGADFSLVQFSSRHLH